MSKEKSRRSKHSSGKLSSFKQPSLRQMQSQILAPIYDKVQFLRRELEERMPANQLTNFQETFNKTCKQHFLSLGVDRDTQIQKMRKKYQSQHQIEIQVKETTQNIQSKTLVNWKDNNRNQTKSLMNFLSKNKIVTSKHGSRKQNKDYIQKKQLKNKVENEEQFEPVGEQYKKQKLYQQSLKSQTQSLSSFRPQSSLQSSKIRGAVSRQSSKKYLRKGTRVRQILMRQLQTPDQRGSSASSLTYLKDYDQWVPTTFVQQKKAELQSFMNIIYGQKKVKEQNTVDLNKINLIYL